MAYKVLSNKLIHRVLIISGVYVLLPFLYIAKYDHPSADDYAYQVKFSEHGLWHVFKDNYYNWSGRYFSPVIYWFNPARYRSLENYRVFAVMMILLFAVVTVILVNSLLKAYLSFQQVLGSSCLFLFLYFSKTPGISEAFYWFSSASIYQSANILVMLLLVTLIKLRGRDKPPGARALLYVLVCTILCIAIIGCNEVSLIITVLFVFFYTLSQYSVDKKWNRHLTVLCVVCTLFSMAEVFAPGNFRRLNEWQHFSRSIPWTIAGSLSVAAVYVSQWAGPVLAVSVLYVPLFGVPIAQKMENSNRSIGVPLKSFVWYFIGTFCFLQVFIIWVAGGSDLGRIYDVIYFFFLLGYFFSLQLLLNRNIHRLKKMTPYSPACCLLGLALFLASLFDIDNNVSTAYVDLISGKARQYDLELTKRVTLARECKSDTCYVPALSAIPSTIFFTDIRPLPDTSALWINEYYSKYFGVGFVVSDNPPPVATPNLESLRNLGKTMRKRIVKAR